MITTCRSVGLVCVMAWLGGPANVRGACSMVVEITNSTYAGSYNLAEGDSTFYRVGRASSSYESRNWFVFSLPTFPAPLARAELRVYAGIVWTNVTLNYELHQVTTPPDVVINHSGDRAATFADLGDGPVLGGRTIYGTNGMWWDASALLGIPLNAAGLAELTARQGQQVCLGGAIAPEGSSSGGRAFEGTSRYPIQLVLYFSNAGPPEITAGVLDPSTNRMADERINLAHVVCGKEPLHKQWTRDGVLIPGATNEILEIRKLAVANSGAYQLVASNDAGVAVSTPVHVTVAPVRISIQPQSRTVTEGQMIELFVSAASRLSPVRYQWRKDGVNLPGRDFWRIAFSPVRMSDAGVYDVVIANNAGAVTSAVAQITVNPAPPSFPPGEPADHHVAVGLPVQLTFPAWGGTPSEHQWFRDGEAIPGGTSNVLHIGSVGFNDAGAYWLVAANSAGRATSAVVNLIVDPLVITNLVSQSVPLLNHFTLMPSVQSSVPMAFQWYFNDAALPSETSSSIFFSAFDHTNAGPYFLVASNVYGVVTSSVATLTVVTSAAIAYATPSSRKAWVGDEVTFFGSASGAPPPTLRWLFNGVPLAGETQALLILRGVTASHSGTYSFVAQNAFGTATAGPLNLNVVAEAPFFLTLPKRTNAVADSIVTLRTRAVGGPQPTYQWRKDGADLPGQTNRSLALGCVDMGDSGVYEVVARNALGEARYQHPFTVSPRTGLDRWQWRLPRPQGSRLHDVAWSGGRYVAVGKSGNLITSADSHNWTSVTVETDAHFEFVTFANGVFVASGWINDPVTWTNTSKVDAYFYYGLEDQTGVILVSSNGLDWSPAFGPDDNYLDSIAFGNGTFVGVGPQEQAVYTSTDGLNWRKHTPGGGIWDVTFGNGRFVARRGNSLAYSANGIDWTSSMPTDANWLTFADGRFFAWGWFSVYESLDGIEWERIGQPSHVFSDDFSGHGGRFVAVFEEPGQVLYSADGMRWVPVGTGTQQEIESVIYASGEFLGVGEAGTVTRSADGLIWTPEEVANKIDFYGITHGKGLHVMAGDAGTIMTSGNGMDWVKRTTPTTRNLHTVAYGAGMFVAGGRAGTLLSSGDGISWTARNSGLPYYIERIAYGDGLWVAVGEGGAVVVSSNGVDWTGFTTSGPATDHEGVAHGNGVWVAAGGYFMNPESESQAVGTIYSSTNGLNWTARFGNLAGKRWRDVTFGKGKFVAVGNDGMMSVSTNGIDWALPRFLPWQNLRRVVYANGRFVAVGNDGALISATDPTQTWTTHRSHTSQNLHDIHAAPDGRLVFVGNNGMVLQSGDTRPRFVSVDRNGRLEFDAGIAGSLRLERSTDFRMWETEAPSVTSPHNATVEGGSKFWRLVGD